MKSVKISNNFKFKKLLLKEAVKSAFHLTSPIILALFFDHGLPQI